MSTPAPDLVVVLGPTASGKTRLAVALARELHSAVISADSRQVYRGMDLGTGKDRDEYGEVPVHLLDIVDPTTEFNVFAYQRAFGEVFSNCRAAGQVPVLCGGSGLYLEAVIAGYRFGREPAEISSGIGAVAESGSRSGSGSGSGSESDSVALPDVVHAESRLLPPDGVVPLAPLIFGVRWPRDVLRKRITARLRERLEQGLVEEVERLLTQGVSYERLEALGLEYRWTALYLQQNMRYNDFFQRLNSAIHQFAKRQDTWFRKMERNGFDIEWLAGGESLIEDALTRLRSRISQND